MIREVAQTVQQLEPQLLNWRRWLHQHPELSFEEHQTARFIRSILREHRISYTTAIDTATLAFLGTDSSLPWIALRADIDALPITEATHLPYSSRHSGQMHACGHDAHTAMLLAAAVALKRYEAELPFRILFIFQPGEEKLPGGARLLIESGLFEEYPIRQIFGQHLNPELRSGTIGLCPGPFMAATDEIFWEFSARGTHAAQPHRSPDLIVTAALLIAQLQTLISRIRDPLTPSVLSITQIHGGSATNILPHTLTMAGTLRTFQPQWRAQAKKQITRHSQSIARSFGATLTLQIREGYPALVNDPSATEMVRLAAAQLFTAKDVITIPPHLWAEDFAYYTQRVPGCFWTLGVRPPQARTAAGLHTPQFNPDESAFLRGAQLLAALPFSIATKLNTK